MKIALCTELGMQNGLRAGCAPFLLGTDSLSSTSYGMRSSYLRHCGGAATMRLSSQ